MLDYGSPMDAPTLRAAIAEFERVFGRIPGQAAARGSIQDEFDYCDDFDRLGMREVESGRARRRA